MVFLRPPTMWLRSIAGSISLVCTFYALPRLPVADVLTLTNVFPIWVALLSWPMLGEAPSWQAWIAIAVGIFGVVLVQQPHFDAQAPGAALPAILAMVSSMTSAMAMLGLHRLQGIDPRAIVAHFSGVALAVCLASLWLAPDAALVLRTIRRPHDRDAVGRGRLRHDRAVVSDQGLCGRPAGQGLGRGTFAGGLRRIVRRAGVGPLVRRDDAGWAWCWSWRPRPGS